MLARSVAVLALYVALVLAPLGVLLVAPTPAKGGFWWDVAIALGFAGLAMLAIQFVLTARSRAFAAPFGIDVIYYFHRYAAYVLLAIVLAHVVLLAALSPLAASPAMLAGMGSLALLLALSATSAWRKPLRIPYDAWRRGHLALAVGAVALGFAHMRAVDYYSSPAAVSALWSAVGASLMLIVVWVRVLRPWQLRRKPYRLASVTPEQGDAWTLRLVPEGHLGFDFQPGQFVWVSLGHSPFDMREHPFSIASAPQSDGTIEITVKALGDFTRTIGDFPPGTTACVDGPYGAFSIDRHKDAPGYVFIAGGIGVAPMIGMLEALAARDDRRSHLLVAAHSRLDRVPRLDAIEQLATRLDLTVLHVLEEPPPGAPHARGWITRELLDQRLPPDRARREYFVCGPLPMTQAVERFLHQLGVPPARVHSELFDMA